MHRLFWSRTSVAVRLAFVLFGFPILIFTFIALFHFSSCSFSVSLHLPGQASCSLGFFHPSILFSLSFFFFFFCSIYTRWHFYLASVRPIAIIMQYNSTHIQLFFHRCVSPWTPMPMTFGVPFVCVCVCDKNTKIGRKNQKNSVCLCKKTK